MNPGGHVTAVIAIFIIVMVALFLQYSSQIPFTLFPANNGSSVVARIGSSDTHNANPLPSSTVQDVIAACKSIDEDDAKIEQFNPMECCEWHGGSTEDQLIIDEDSMADYIERRVNIPLPQIEFLGGAKFRHMQKVKDQVEIDGKKYEVYFPVKSGEFLGMEGLYYSKSRCNDPNDDSKCGEHHRIYFIDYELVFLRHLDINGNPVIIPGTETSGNEYNLADIYQSRKASEDDEVGPLPDEAFRCSSLNTDPSASPIAPPPPPPISPPPLQVNYQSQSPDHSGNDLQLSWFLFAQPEEGVPIPQPVPELKFFEIGCKPAVYLYPPTEQLVNVRVFPKGFLTYTDPIYDSKTGWNILASPTGLITTAYNVAPTTYPYLYYESKIEDQAVNKPEEGWVIQSGGSRESNESDESKDSKEWFMPLEVKFNELLPKLGLNNVQTRDFIEYWRKALPYSPYYFVGIVDQDNVNEFERLEITPKPDFVNRVRIYFERLDQPRQVQPPVLSSTNYQPLTTNFNVIEWGGMVKNDPNHPFTCSQ